MSTILIKCQAFIISWLDFNDSLCYGSFWFKCLFILHAYPVLLFYYFSDCPPLIGQWFVQTPSFCPGLQLRSSTLSWVGLLLSGAKKVTAGFVWPWPSGHLGSEYPVFLVCLLNASWAPPNRVKPPLHSSLFLIIILYISISFTTKPWASQRTESMCCPYFHPQHLSQCMEANLIMLNRQINK